jgi:2,4-dienoyl-CoA reductase-like NADH-dependent reductase (Old Yellow Enzyme family)/threonine dehydrogenase-like Zn-dependent dehydrogenase
MTQTAEASSSFPNLFTPLRIGPVESRNRIVLGAHFTQFTEPTTPGEPGHYGARYARYLAGFARGGAGLVIGGQAAVHPTTAYQMPNNASAWDAAAVPGLTEIANAVHEHGSLVFLQLAHNGGVNGGAWSKLPAWAPSLVANYMEPPKPIEHHEIAQVIEGFAQSAANCAAAGLDGVEIHAAHGYLIHEFLSPHSNHRTDEYGGDLERRMRFCVEVLQAVRAAVGDAIAVGVRLVGDEETRDGSGLGPEDAGEIAARLEAAGLVDFVNVSVGTSGMGMVRPLYSKHLLGVPATRTVRAALEDTPVFAVHRVLTPVEAEGIIADGAADAVTVVRALIADPEWPEKARTGRVDEIRHCTGCNQGCYGNLTAGLPITCVTNPVTGREEALGGPLPAAARSKRVVVIGGGPGGLEAAWVAQARGHEVILLERDAELGGKIRLAAALPGREELADFADWRAAECERRGVDIRLGVEATTDSVLALAPDAVIVATGGNATTSTSSKWHPLPVSGSDQDWVIDHERALLHALADPSALGERVVILDAVGDIAAIGVGHVLALAGIQVTAVTPLPNPILIDNETNSRALPRAARAGMTWRPNTAMVQIADHTVTLADALTYQMETLDADTVVIRTHGEPRAGLYFALLDRVPEVTRIGDAVAVRWADRAIYDGHLAARAL